LPSKVFACPLHQSLFVSHQMFRKIVLGGTILLFITRATFNIHHNMFTSSKLLISSWFSSWQYLAFLDGPAVVSLLLGSSFTLSNFYKFSGTFLLQQHNIDSVFAIKFLQDCFERHFLV
jgi:hypothetical protein